MTKLILLCFVGITLALPHGTFYNDHHSNYKTSYHSYNPYMQYKPVPNTYAKPLGYMYLEDPMSQVNMKLSAPASSPYAAYFQGQKMLGELFFKHPGHVHSHGEEDTVREEPPYTVINTIGSFEHREYPAANFACVKSEVDLRDDPLAGLENVDPLVLMSSNRWQKTPTSLMFKELFKYISGVNQEGVKVEMTRPVSTRHSAKQDQREVGAELEELEMCFYIPAEHQANPPKPLENSPVYIYNRPSMRLYSHRALSTRPSQDVIRKVKGDLDVLLHRERDYFVSGYSDPRVQPGRHEIWIPDLEDVTPQVAAVEVEVEGDVEDVKGEEEEELGVEADPKIQENEEEEKEMEEEEEEKEE